MPLTIEEFQRAAFNDEDSYHLSIPPSTDDELEYGEDDYDGRSLFEDEHSQNSSKPDSEPKADLEDVEETRQIWTLAAFVKIVLVVATALTAAAIFYNLRAEEEEQFENLFEDHAQKVMDGLETNIWQTIEVLDNFGVLYTSHARVSGANWPYGTLPDFEFRGESTMSLIHAEFMSFVPMVKRSERMAWEQYALSSRSWVPVDISSEAALAENVFGSDNERHGGSGRYLQSGKQSENVRPDQSPDEEGSSYTQKNGSENVDKPGQPTPSPPTLPPMDLPPTGEPVEYQDGIATRVFRVDQYGRAIVEDYKSDLFLPTWQCTPTVLELINYNLLSHGTFGEEARETIDTGNVVLGRAVDFVELTSLHKDHNPAASTNEPVSQVYVPVFDDFDGSRTIVAMVTALLRWGDYLTRNLPSSTNDRIVCVIENDCDQQFSYRIEGQEATFLGHGDKHDSQFNYLEESVDFETLMKDTEIPHETFSGVEVDSEYCPYRIRVFPTAKMEDQYITRKPVYYSVAVLVVLLFTVLMLALLSYLQERRHRKILESAKQTNAVVSSLFPAVVRDRLLGGGKGSLAEAASAKRQLKSYLDKGKKKDKRGSKPIADLFPETTVMFADIAGFTAWSSVREPTQVFTLLESIYQTFDRTAKKRSVFKVETIGDCYVAVTGLPDPQPDHAIIMAKFAIECMYKMNELAPTLERTLGPDTGDLKMRFGMHSGPTTAGVLRGEKSRFQLFGDTVNTAARMESTGKSDRIQCSQATADLIINGGKAHWICPRNEIVKAKGKGEVQTFWIEPLVRGGDKSSSNRKMKDFSMSSNSLVWGESTSFEHLPVAVEMHKHQRLVEFNVDVLKKLLKRVAVSRARRDHSRFDRNQVQDSMGTGANPRDQVTEAIVMPQFDLKSAKKQVNPEGIKVGLSAAVVSQLKSYVAAVASMYHDDNPFHNYEHASHVTMSANKLLKRVVVPDAVYDRKASVRKMASNLHQYTYGITSDPLTQFSIVFSALIHDVDHCGVSNGQLVKEDTKTAKKYDGKSVAEQNSVDLAWNLLMDKEYKDLQSAIYANEAEFRRFRQLVVNSVVATDIFDKDLKDLRNRRWEIAFHQNIDDKNLKATIVIEHIIQAADVSHTMQHWHIYQKWNERLFKEVYGAYRSGRGGEKDPSEGWYNGELWFFDNYVIPLAKKLKECGVFGVASAECLTYALDNRREWESKGERIVERMKENYSAPKWAQSSLSVGSNDNS